MAYFCTLVISRFQSRFYYLGVHDSDEQYFVFNSKSTAILLLLQQNKEKKPCLTEEVLGSCNNLFIAICGSRVLPGSIEANFKNPTLQSNSKYY